MLVLLNKWSAGVSFEKPSIYVLFHMVAEHRFDCILSCIFSGEQASSYVTVTPGGDGWY